MRCRLLPYAQQFARVITMANDSTLRATLRLVVSDIRRMCDQWQVPFTAVRAILMALTPPLLALLFYRWSRYFYVKRLRIIARGLWCLNVYVTGADINPDAEIGESFLLGHPVGTVIGRARIGHHVTVYGQAGIGGGGKGKDVGDDWPTIGDYVHIGVRAVV